LAIVEKSNEQTEKMQAGYFRPKVGVPASPKQAEYNGHSETQKQTA
jgi:hypothetical protein